MTKKITAILLAGGESSRFWPLDHKMLLPFLGKPLFQWQLEQLVKLGFSKIIVVANKNNVEEISRLTKILQIKPIIVRQVGRGQKSAVLSVKEVLYEEPLIILNSSDIYEDSFILELLSSWQKQSDKIFLGAVKITSYFPGGYLKLGKDGLIKDIIEKPEPGKEPSEIIRVNADIFPSAKLIIDSIIDQHDGPDLGYEPAIISLIKKGFECQAFIKDTSWKYLKYPWHVLEVTETLLGSITSQNIGQNVKIAKHVVLEGPMIIEDNVIISDFTQIIGPCYIGKNTIIGNNNIIRASHVGADCVTGFNTDIARSYIGNNCWFHSNYVGDSVIEGDVSMGSGNILANLRLDEGEIFSVVRGQRLNTKCNKLGAIIGKHVRIGVNTSIMPGVKIGTNSMVGAGLMIDRDIPEGSFVAGGTSMTITKNTRVIQGNRTPFKQKLS